MKVIQKKRYSFFLLEDEETQEWFLTFMTGGPFEVDICVKLSEDEVSSIKQEPEYVSELMKSFKSDRSLYEGRRVIPSKRPNRSK